ncbi:MAG: AAC(3) family N-acetyltransferase [Sulfuritalea sp.]|nr:AAC(3) family N-acetyltransferase [Sulfuritalea sp.]
MKLVSKSELADSLLSLGIGLGDIVHVQSDLRRIGPVDAHLTREDLCEFYLSTLQSVVGPEGTLTVCTAFEDYGRYGTAFVREESPSRTDMFSEYLRTRPGAHRSMHPIVSVAGLGARAAEICNGSHYEGFGYQSAWGRLHRANAKILTLGMGADLGGTTFFHYVERLYGVPYVYTKLFTYPVFAEGRQIQGPFTMSVRYLDFNIVNTPVKVKNSMLIAGKARQSSTGRALSWCAAAEDIVEHMMSLLDRDRWAMLEKPPKFRPGVLPMDGQTGDMQVWYDMSDQK